MLPGLPTLAVCARLGSEILRSAAGVYCRQRETFCESRIHSGPRVSRSKMVVASPLVVYARAVNWILGAGVLGVPFAFASVGILSASVSLIIVSVLSFLTCLWMLEVDEHANALQHLFSVQGSSPHAGVASAMREGSLAMPLLRPPEVQTQDSDSSEPMNGLVRNGSISMNLHAWMEGQRNKNAFGVPDWKARGTVALEVSQLATIFLGKGARRAWLISLTALQMCSMWACCAIWIACASVAVSPPPSSPPSELLMLCAFAVVIVPLCLVDPQKLGGMQLFSALATLCTMALMLITLIQAVLDPAHRVHSHEPASFSLLIYSGDGMGRALATLVFSQLVQQSIPKLAHDAIRPELTAKILLTAVFTTCFLYTALGASAAFLFRQDTEKVITLNWLGYTAGFKDPPWWVHTIARWVSLLPLFTTTSAYPLFNATLAANLLEALPPGILHKRWLTGLLCAVPPIFCTAFISDTSLIFGLAGLCGYGVMFGMPALLLITSRRWSKLVWGDAGHDAPHSTPFSSETSAFFILLVSALCFVFSAALLVHRICLQFLN
uniref:Amino acid transporter transmembrane domain-containing protein n=1 Tax=Chrysotila carterae TaxID=13221 RepID=A0A7S4FB15_CHRCT